MASQLAEEVVESCREWGSGKGKGANETSSLSWVSQVNSVLSSCNKARLALSEMLSSRPCYLDVRGPGISRRVAAASVPLRSTSYVLTCKAGKEATAFPGRFRSCGSSLKGSYEDF